MTLDTSMNWLVALYVVMITTYAGYQGISRVPSILHTPLMSGANFVHGIVVVGALHALFNATSPIAQVVGFLGVALGSANAAGGYVVTDRMLGMFKGKKKPELEE